MESVKQLLAFPLYATVVWLAWVLGQQAGIDAVARLLIGLVLIAAGCWAMERRGRGLQSARATAKLAGIVAIAAGIAVAWPGAHEVPNRPAAQLSNGQPARLRRGLRHTKDGDPWRTVP